jgi:hypothetical protein
MKQQYSGKNTSSNNWRLPKLFKQVEKFGGFTAGTSNIDLGCGRDPSNVTEFMSKRDVTNIPVDPNWDFPAPTEEQLQQVVGSITISNVLNVIKEKRARISLLAQAALLASRDDAHVYISIYQGDKSGRGRRTKKDCWQLHQPTDWYLREVRSVFPVVEKKAGIIVARLQEGEYHES